MARIRTIKPSFFKNEELAELPFTARLFFIGLWTQADREGKLEYRPKRLKAELFPYDNLNIDDLLSRLQSAGFIKRYEVGELKLIQINKFSKHQSPNIKEAKSELPNEHSESTMPAPCLYGESILGREGKGEEGNERTISDLKMEDCKLPPDDIGFKIIQASIRLYEGFRAHFPLNKDLPLILVSDWVKPVRRLMEKKGYTYDQIAEVLNWTMEDKFWKNQIINTETLEKHFEKLKIQYHGSRRVV